MATGVRLRSESRVVLFIVTCLLLPLLPTDLEGWGVSYLILLKVLGWLVHPDS
jgi:hypothetical protein